MVPDSVVPTSSLKVYRWVKTDRVQQFSDDEGEADDPLAPLPDEPDVADVEEDDPEDDQLKVISQVESRELSEAPRARTVNLGQPSGPGSPKTHPLATSFISTNADAEDNEQPVPAPEILLDPLGPSEAPHLEPLNEEDLGVLGLPGLTNPDDPSYDMQNSLNVVDADTVMKDISEEV